MIPGRVKCHSGTLSSNTRIALLKQLFQYSNKGKRLFLRPKQHMNLESQNMWSVIMAFVSFREEPLLPSDPTSNQYQSFPEPHGNF